MGWLSVNLRSPPSLQTVCCQNLYLDLLEASISRLISAYVVYFYHINTLAELPGELALECAAALSRFLRCMLSLHVSEVRSVQATRTCLGPPRRPAQRVKT